VTNEPKITIALAGAAAQVNVDVETGIPGERGMSAYEYAKAGGYKGTEKQFTAKLAQELPSTLPNPQRLYFLDEQLAAPIDSYDGSKAKFINIPNAAEVQKAAVAEAKYAVSWNNLLDKPFGSQGVDGVVYSVAGLAMDEDGMGLVADPSLVLYTGFEYAVSWNGTVYSCTAWELEMDGEKTVCLGNKSAAGGDDTGEPFMVLTLPPAMVEAVGFSGQVIAFDGSTYVDMTITGTELVTKLDEKYIPDEIPRAERYEVVRSVTLDAEATEIDITGLELSKADVFLEVPQASGSSNIRGDAYSAEGALGLIDFVGAVSADGTRHTFMHAESVNGRSFVEGSQPVAYRGLAGTVHRSSYGSDGYKPINKIRFFGATPAPFPAGTTVVIKGVQADA